MADFAAARAQIKSKVGGALPSSFYPFWNIDQGAQVGFRFLPNYDASNPCPWVEKRTIRLPFDGVVGESSDPVTVSVQCIEQHGLVCPIGQMNKPYWKSNPDLARKRWRKISYLMQGFLVGVNPLPEVAVPESGIWKLALNKSIFEIVEGCALDTDREYAPWDLDMGCVFTIIKSLQGTWASYHKSRYGLKVEAISEAQRAAVESYGLYDLQADLGPVPDAAAIDIIRQLGEDSFDGKAFDAEKYGPYGYRAYRVTGEAVAARTDPGAVLSTLAAKTRVTTASMGK